MSVRVQPLYVEDVCVPCFSQAVSCGRLLAVGCWLLAAAEKQTKLVKMTNNNLQGYHSRQLRVDWRANSAFIALLNY